MKLPKATARSICTTAPRASGTSATPMPPPSASGDYLEALTPDMLANLLSSGRVNVTTKAVAAGKAAVCSRPTARVATAAPPAPPALAVAQAAQLVFSSAAAHGHMLDDHVEQPARVEVILQMLADAGITAHAFEGQVGGRRSAPASAPCLPDLSFQPPSHLHTPWLVQQLICFLPPFPAFCSCTSCLLPSW